LEEENMKQIGNGFGGRKNRRGFLKNGMIAAGAASVASLPNALTVFAREEDEHRPITKGDIAILTFFSALEQIESDLWIQYAELGGPTSNVPSSIGLSPIDLALNGKKIATGLAPGYIMALQVLDGDMPQYIADNTDDEITHHVFLNNYVASKGGKPIDLSEFAILPPSKVTGVPQTGRLTNLQHLTVDTSWWTRYRSATQNPDLGGIFENAVPDLAKAPHTAIPLDDNDATLNSDGTIPNHLQAIASTAGFHFAFIEQGGTGLYPAMAQRVNNVEVLRVLLSIGPTEAMHFQTWQDKAGNAPNITDGDLTFPDLNSGTDPNTGKMTEPDGTPAADLFQTNLIMPEPTFFLHKALGPVSIVRPTDTVNAAMGAVKALTDDGLFFDPATGKNTGVVDKLMRLAEAADDARRGF
jgi:Ferritin-like domain